MYNKYKATLNMDNTLLTKISQYALNLAENEIKSKVHYYLLIGSTTLNDSALNAALDDNDINNNLTYQKIVNNRWNGLESKITSSYFDKNNFLTFDIDIPYETDLNIYVYAFALIEVDGNNKNIISITRSPSIFNKTKYSTSTFSIKITFNQTNKTTQYVGNLFDTQYESKEYSFIGSIDKGSNFILATTPVDTINIGTKIYHKNLPDNTVVIATKSTDSNLNSYQLKLSNNAIENITKEAFFITKMYFESTDYASKAQLDKAINEHNHNKDYYQLNSTVADSEKLAGRDASNYLNVKDKAELLKSLNEKLNKTGGTITGILKYIRDNSTEWQEDEIITLYKANELIKNMEDYLEENQYTPLNNNFEVLTSNFSNLKENVNKFYNSVEETEENMKKSIEDFKESVNTKITNKVDTNDGVFLNNPKVTSTTDITALEENPKTLVTYANVLNILKKIQTEVTINLKDVNTNIAVPVIFCDINSDRYTDTILWSLPHETLDGFIKLKFFGSGAANGSIGCGFQLSHFQTGNDAIVQKVVIPTTSAATILYLRGGFEFKAILRGSDSDITPVIVKSGSYTLKNSTYTVQTTSWTNTNIISTGNWSFNSFKNGKQPVTIDKDTVSHFGEIV